MHFYLNGRYVPEREALIPADDHGFLYGAGVFETFRTFGGRVHLIEAHLERLEAGCRRFNIPYGRTSLTDPVRLREAVAALLRLNDAGDAVFRYTVSAGPAGAGLPRGPYTRPTELLTLRPLPDADPNRPICLHLLHVRRNTPEFDPRPKSLSYANSLAAHLETLSRNPAPGDEGLLATREGDLAEGVASNVFFLRQASLCTPSPGCGILPGIARGEVLRLAAELNIPVREDRFPLDVLRRADAVFITNAVRGIAPVSRVLDTDDNAIWEGDSGAVPELDALIRAYRAALPD